MIKVFRNIEELRPFSAQWNGLAEKAGSPLMNFDWISEAARAFYAEGSLYVIAKFDENNQINALLPLAYRNSDQAGAWLEVIGSSILGEPAGILYGEKNDLVGLINGVRSELKRPALLQRIPADVAEAAFPTGISRQGSIAINRRTARSCYVETDRKMEEIEALMSGRRRYDLRRAAKRAQVLGELSSLIILPGIDEIDDYLNEAMRIEAACWKGKNGSSMLDNERMRAFFRGFLRLAAKDKKAVLGFLKIADQSIAMQIAIREFGAMWVLKIGYDDKFSRCSPGLLLTHEMISFCTHNGCNRYEFLGSTESWLNMWPVKQHDYCTVASYPYNIKGLCAISLDSVRMVWGRIGRVLSN